MATREREKTRDELDLKTLRELAALPTNKSCFDCGLRGPTYVNTTIGAFICSTCGGILRGLNPPHRVKSLTMSSFTEIEMDRIKSRGNEYCTHIWLGRCDPKVLEFDLTNSDKRKEFMIQKYEEKRYYVEPCEAIKKMKPRAPPIPSATCVTQSKSHTVIQSRPHPSIQKPGALPQTFSTGDIPNKSAPNLFQKSDTDPFKEVKGDAADCNSFADFSSAFDNCGPTGASVIPSSSVTTSSSASHKKPAPPPPDRYAALADLDNQLHQQVDIPPVASTVAPLYWANTGPISSVVYAPATQNPFSNAAPSWSQPLSCAPNPFQAATSSDGTPPQHNRNGLPKQQSLPNGGVGSAYWSSGMNCPWGSQQDPFATKSTTVPGNYNPWAQSYGSNNINPFLNGQGMASNAAQLNSKKNPFL